MGQVRTLGRRLRLAWAVPGAVVVIIGAVLAGTVLASAASPALPRRTPAQLLAGLRHATLPNAMTAVVSETTNLGFPALPDLPGMSSSALSTASLLAGTHTVQIWYAGPRHVRIALPVAFGETDLRVNGNQVWLWDSQGQKATRYVPGATPKPEQAGKGAPPAAIPSGPGGFTGPVPKDPFAGLTPLQAAQRVLAMVGKTTRVTVPGTVQIAGRSAYQLAIAPRTSQSLIGRIVIAIDAATHLPLDVQVFARGASSPALHIGFTSLSFAKPAMSNFTFTPPPGAHVKTATRPAGLPALFSGTPGPAGKPGQVNPGGPMIPAGVPGHAPAAGAQVLGTGWLSVAAITPAQPKVVVGGVNGKNTGGKKSAAYHSRLVITGLHPQVSPLLALLLKAARPVHGSWGSGRLLRTSLLSVLVTSKGEVLIGAVTPAVLYADVAKVK